MSDKKKLKNLLDQGLISEEEYTKGIRKSSNSSLIKIGVGVLAAVSVLIAVSNPSGVEDQPSLSVSEPVTESKEISPNNASSDLQPTTTISKIKSTTTFYNYYYSLNNYNNNNSISNDWWNYIHLHTRLRWMDL